MRSSIKTTTNVSYDNRAVDITQEGLSYKINSDHISYISTTYTDLDSRASTTRTLGDGVSTDYERGQTITVTMASDTSFVAGHDYMGQQTIYQRQAGDMSEETSPGQYNVYMGAGRVQTDSSTATEVYIDKDIGFIRTPVTRNSKLVGGCVLRLSDRDLLISAYNPTTGKATVAGAKINGTTSTTRTTTAGENYKLITNYLVCDAFVFYYRTTPTLSITCELTTNGIEATGTYSQAEGTEIQSWRMWADYNDAGSGYEQRLSPMKLYHETHWNTTIEDVFPLSCTDGYSEIPDDPAAVDIYLEVTTQDGVTVQTMQRLGFSAGYPLTVTAAPFSSLTVEGLPGGNYFVFREQNISDTSPAFIKYKYSGSRSSANAFYDAEQGYCTTYRYIVCGVDDEGNIYYGRSNSITYPAKYWSIQHITKTGYNTYHIDDSPFTFMVDIDPSQIETVMGGMAYSTEGRYPKYIHGSDRYDTGSFTALLGSISGTHKLEASAYYIERWNEFISQKGLFLLKTDSGDVKIIAITGNPARQYGTSLEEIGITRVTYSWTEMANIDEVVVT